MVNRLLIMILASIAAAIAFAQTADESLPRPGNLDDILMCAGSNEMLWTTAIRIDPYDVGAHRAKAKAGWYAAVALEIFQVDSAEVLRAISSARQHEPSSEIFDIAARCRQPPSAWAG